MWYWPASMVCLLCPRSSSSYTDPCFRKRRAQSLQPLPAGSRPTLENTFKHEILQTPTSSSLELAALSTTNWETRFALGVCSKGGKEPRYYYYRYYRLSKNSPDLFPWSKHNIIYPKVAAVDVFVY